jgi:hypothetical protein
MEHEVYIKFEENKKTKNLGVFCFFYKIYVINNK